MAMVFSGPDRPNKILETKINNGDTPYKDLLFNGNNSFQSILASKRYETVAENARRFNYFDKPLQKSLSEIAFKMGRAAYDVTIIESPHLRELEKLAVELVCREMSIPKGLIDFDVKIVNYHEIDSTNFNKSKVDKLDSECEKFDQEIFKLERNKRRIINSLIQGAAKKGHYMYMLAEKELEDIVKTKNLVSAYNIMMSVNDTYYWQIDDTTMDNMVHSSNPVGTSEVDFPDDYENNEVSPKVIARAINFPVLVHEIVKGVIELFSYHGQNEDEKMAIQVIRLEDTLSKEIWDLRFGPAIWDLYREQIPSEILVDEGLMEIQNYLLVDIFKLEASEFMLLFEDILSNKANPRLSKMVNDIKLRMATDEYERTMRNFGMWDEE